MCRRFPSVAPTGAARFATTDMPCPIRSRGCTRFAGARSAGRVRRISGPNRVRGPAWRMLAGPPHRTDPSDSRARWDSHQVPAADRCLPSLGATSRCRGLPHGAASARRAEHPGVERKRRDGGHRRRPTLSLTPAVQAAPVRSIWSSAALSCGVGSRSMCSGSWKGGSGLTCF